MKSPRRSKRSTKSHSLFSFSQWKLQDEYWTSQSKRLRKAAKKTSTQDITAKPIDGRTEIQDLNKQEIGGADYISDKEGRSLIISGVKSVGYPSSTASHSITEKSRSAHGNCVNKRNVIKEKTQLKVTWIAESTDMIVENRKKAGGNGNIVKLKKARKNKTDIVVNPIMETYKKMKCQNEDSNVNERNVIKEKTQLKVTWIAESTDMIVDRKKAGGNGNIVKLKKDRKNKTDIVVNPNMETYKKMKCQNEDSNVLNSGEFEMRCRAGNMGIRASLGIISDVPSAIPSFPNDMENSSSGIISDIPSFKPYSTDDFQPRQNVTVDSPRPSVIMETPRGIISRGWPHDCDTIGVETPRDTISRDGPQNRDTIGMETPRGIIGRGWPQDRDTIGMDVSRHITEVGSASGKVDTPTMYLTKESDEAREAVSSREGAQLGVDRERENRAGLEVVGPSVEVDDQVVYGAVAGSRSEGVNHSVDNSAQEAVGGAVGSHLEVVKYSVVTQIKIKMEIELSTAQFIEVAHVLPALGSSTNAVL